MIRATAGRGPERLIAFLRAINVGGHTVTMERLRRLFSGLGLTDVETFIASGNVIFRAGSGPVPPLEGRIANALEPALGFPVGVFIRTAREVSAVARHKPFPPDQMEKAGALSVGFLAKPLAPARRTALLALRTDLDDFHVSGREVYWWCKGGQSDSKFSGPLLERTLGVPATFRNVRTVARLAARYGTPS